MSSKYGGVSKPSINTSRSSDRRLAAGRQPAAFLHAAVTHRGPLAASVSVSPAAGGSAPPPQYALATKTVPQTVQRSGGGKTWQDPTLLEWNPAHFRLFVGNLGADATDDLLTRAFAPYPSLSKARVPKDPKTGENKGYGFVAFESSADFLKAFKEMNGKYVGQRPVVLKRAETAVTPTQANPKAAPKGGKRKGK